MAGPDTLGSDDGHLHADRVQVALLRQATVARRITLARSLSRTTARLARRAIRRASPDASEQDIALTFVAIHYGQDLADRLRVRLATGT
jgi:hypothetical protein